MITCIRVGRLAVAALLLLCLPGTWAQTVYKSVDAQGNVTYSSSPPPYGSQFVEKVPIAPPPPEAQRRAAEERLRRLEAESERERQEQAERRAESVITADEDLQRARLELEQATIRSDDDWQYLSTGSRVPTQSYLDRVERARQKVKQAEETQRKARGERP